MPNTIEYLEEEQIIRVDSFGDSGIEEWNNSLDQVMKINARTGATRVLIDTRRQKSAPNTLHLFNFAASLPIALRFALVVSGSASSDLGFLETVGRNRGKSIQLFQDYAAAQAWLHPDD